MKKAMLMLMATAAISAYAQDAQVLSADVENILLWNYTTTAWKDYQVNEQTFNVTAENLTENISWVMESSGKAKGSYVGEGTTRFELINNGLYEANSGQLGIRVTSKEPGIFEDVIVLTSGDLEVRIPVCLKVAGTEGDGYWDDNDFCPLTIADANAIHDIMPANTSYATDATHKFDTYGGDNGYRFFRGVVSGVTSVGDGTISFNLTDAEGGLTMTVLNAKGIDGADVNAEDYVQPSDVVTLEGDIADVDLLCALKGGTIYFIEHGGTPAEAPAVTMEPGAITSSSIELTFTPNEATSTYYCCLFGEGELQAQYDMFGAWMGFTCYGDMIKAWGYSCEGEQTKTWNDLAPGTTYEIYVQPLDASGAYGELQCFTVTTGSQGGNGASVIEIEIGEFGGDEVNGHWQQVIYTPNDQTAVFFDLICTEEFYQANGAEGVIAYLKEEADPSSLYYSYYAQYTQDNAYWNAEPGTTYHACAIGMNAQGEWGELADVVFTTPGGETAIQNIEAAKDVKALRYNLQGQQTNGNNGLMIQNGRVVLVK